MEKNKIPASNAKITQRGKIFILAKNFIEKKEGIEKLIQK
jgi:hypothetical protein